MLVGPAGPPRHRHHVAPLSPPLFCSQADVQPSQWPPRCPRPRTPRARTSFGGSKVTRKSADIVRSQAPRICMQTAGWPSTSVAVVLSAREQGGRGPWGELPSGGGVADPVLHLCMQTAGWPSTSVAVVLSAREQGARGPWGELPSGGGVADPVLHWGLCAKWGAGKRGRAGSCSRPSTARLAVRAVVAADGRGRVWRKQRLPPMPPTAAD